MEVVENKHGLRSKIVAPFKRNQRPAPQWPWQQHQLLLSCVSLMAFQRSRSPRRGMRVFLRSLLFCAAASCALAAQETFTWITATQEELADMMAKVEAGAAAEALLYKVEIDDKKDSRRYHIIARYKIYDPERAASLLTINYDQHLGGNTTEVRARITLPSGAIKEFDDKAFLERKVENKTKEGGIIKLLGLDFDIRTEKYLPLAGVERGAIVEIHTKWKAYISEIELWMLQRPEIPVRKAEYMHWLDTDYKELKVQVEGLNRTNIDTKLVNKRVVQYSSASNLPAIHGEPLSGPLSDYCTMTILCTTDKWRRYAHTVTEDPDLLIKKAKEGHKIVDGAWNIVAWNLAEFAKEHGRPTSRTKKLAATLCANADSDLEKARRIHNYVVGLRQQYILFSQQADLQEKSKVAGSPHDVLDFKEGNRTFLPEDFLYLALSLYQAQALDASLLALPDRSLLRFNPKIVSFEMLPYSALGIFIDGRWYFSDPSNQLPFNFLPLKTVGQVALVAQSGQEFIPVPIQPADTTRLTQTGQFKLDATGKLEGDGNLSLTGYFAASLRAKLRDLDEAARKKLAKELYFNTNLPATTLEIGAINGLDAIEAPLEIHFKLTWEAYAVRTENRLVVRPGVFRFAARSPFTASTRKTPVVFPHRWCETDNITLDLPRDFTLEDPASAPQYPGKSFSYTSKLQYSGKTHRLIFNRDYMVNYIEVIPASYPTIKKLHELIQQSDENEIVLKIQESATPSTAPASANTPGS